MDATETRARKPAEIRTLVERFLETGGNGRACRGGFISPRRTASPRVHVRDLTGRTASRRLVARSSRPFRMRTPARNYVVSSTTLGRLHDDDATH